MSHIAVMPSLHSTIQQYTPIAIAHISLLNDPIQSRSNKAGTGGCRRPKVEKNTQLSMLNPQIHRTSQPASRYSGGGSLVRVYLLESNFAPLPPQRV